MEWGTIFFRAQLQLDVEIHPFQGEEDFKYRQVWSQDQMIV